MRCATCGHENRGSAAFCDHCGSEMAFPCPRCANAVRPGARFCDACGDPVSPKDRSPDLRSYAPRDLVERILRERRSIEGERRNVSVLFIDAVSSVAAGERLDAEELHGMVREGTRRMIEAVARFEGTVTQFRGDGVMALFGAPLAQEDSARRAVSAALAMRESLKGYAEELRSAGSRAFEYRIGINSGPVVVGAIGDDLAMDYTAIGDTVNLAARMEQWAPSGRIYLTEATQRAVDGYFEMRDLGRLEIKGKSEGVHAYEVIRELPVRGRLSAAAERGLTPYVGREQETGLLRSSFERAAAGRGEAVFVAGEAGIGKSRLLLEFARSLENTPHTWVEGHCISYGRSIPYLAIVDLLKRAFGVEEADDEAAIIARIEERVASWDEGARTGVPYLRYLLNVDPGDTRVTAMDAAQRRAGIIDALRAAVAQENRQQPVVLVIEDLHWIDERSEEAIRAMLDALDGAQVLMVLTHRPGYQHPFGDRTYYSRIALRPLAASDGAQMARSVLGAASLPVDLQELITRKAEGNPFFVEEVTKSLQESGAIHRDGDALVLRRSVAELRVPDSIQEVILTRIDRLPPPAREALQLASVIGREFTARLLERIADIEVKLDDVLLELKTLEIIFEKRHFPELAYMFKHALTHEVALSTLLTVRRKTLHRVVATAIEELYADRLVEQYEILAHHYYEGDEWQKALEYLIKAGDKAVATYANNEAIAFYARALEVGGRIGSSSTQAVAETAHKKSIVHFTIGEMAAAAATCDVRIDAARAAGDRYQEGLALTFRGFFELWDHEFEASLAALQEAQAIGREGYDDVLFYATMMCGMVFLVMGNMEEAQPYREATAELHPAAGDRFLVEWWAIFRAAERFWSGDWDLALERIAWMREVGDAENDIPSFINLAEEESFALVGKGEYTRALELLHAGLAACERIGELPFRGRILNTLGWVHGELLNYEQAIDFNRRSMELAIAMPAPDVEIESNARLNLADDLVALGRLAEAEDEFRIVERVVRYPTPQERWILWSYSQHFFHSFGELWLTRGDAKQALLLADECIELAERTGRKKNIVKGRRLRGQALMALGDLAPAQREFDAALAIARPLGNPPQLWKTLVALGDLHACCGRPVEAQAAYAEATGIIDGVAASLSEGDLRTTFVSSQYVRSIREKRDAAV